MPAWMRAALLTDFHYTLYSQEVMEGGLCSAEFSTATWWEFQKRSEMNATLNSSKTYQIIHWDFCMKTCQSSKALGMTETETAKPFM